jgi:hypothetical protein
LGAQPVAVLVEKPATAVRFELDGKAVGRVEKAPWTVSVAGADGSRSFAPLRMTVTVGRARG